MGRLIADDLPLQLLEKAEILLLIVVVGGLWKLEQRRAKQGQVGVTIEILPTC